jgi:ArsR family transcriptional regulator
MTGVEEILNSLGNKTRRRILFLLAGQPRFVSEISERLGVGRKAIIDHLGRLESSDLVTSVERRVSQGRPRKYYEIKKEVFFNIGICPSFVDFSEMESTQEISDIDKLDMELDELEIAPVNERRMATTFILNKLESQMKEMESEWVELQRLLNRTRKLLNK